MQPPLVMRIHILSDLHLEFAPFAPPSVDSDVLVLAGDTHIGTHGIDWAMEMAGNRDVIYLLGNHEYYGQALPALVAKLKERSAGSRVHVLENDSVIIDGVVFLGCTLWTDFRLGGRAEIARYEARSSMTDYRKIRVSPRYRRLAPSDTAVHCQRSQLWLRERCRKTSSMPRIVVTHHAPSARSLPPKFADDILSAAYASDLDELVEATGAALWIHGHIHTSCDYHIGDTRVICNPRGYPDESDTGFNPSLTIEL